MDSFLVALGIVGTLGGICGSILSFLLGYERRTTALESGYRALARHTGYYEKGND